MRSAIDLGEKAVSGMSDEHSDDYVVAGRTNLMDYDDLSDVTKLRQLFNACLDLQSMARESGEL